MQIEDATVASMRMNGDKYWKGTRENKNVWFVGVVGIFS